MRLTFVSVALLALAHSLAPGVHGAPAAVSDHMNSLAARQGLAALVGVLLDPVTGALQNILGSAVPLSPQLIEQVVEQIAQELQKSSLGAVTSVIPRAVSVSSDSTPSASLTTPSSTTTSTVSADQTGTKNVGNASSVSLTTPQASSKHRTRMRRQLPPSIPTPGSSIVGSQGVLGSVPSIPAPTHPSVGPMSSESAPSKPTTSNPSSSTGQA